MNHPTLRNVAQQWNSIFKKILTDIIGYLISSKVALIPNVEPGLGDLLLNWKD